jgi:uncharacterized membrane protein HdeD (DUF308 family)
MGAASIVLGGAALVSCNMVPLATIFFMGCLVLGGGALHLIESLNTPGGAGYFGHVLGTILYGVPGGYILAHPGIRIVSLALLIGMLFAVGGFYQIVTSSALRYRSWGWALLQGSVSLLLGVFIYRQWPDIALWVMEAFIGIDLIFRGLATFMLAMGMRSSVKPLLENGRASIYERRMKERRLAA